MLSFFRRVTSSKIGTWVMAAILIAILAGFASTGITNFGSGNIGFGLGSNALATAGGQEVSEQEMAEGMQRRLQQVRQQRPDADYSSIMGDFNTLLDELIDEKALMAFADKFQFPLSKRLIDAEIAQIPQTRGLNGQFSQQAYQGFLQQQRLTDATLRDVLAGGLLQRFMITPVAANARVSVGMATPYAAMLLESRDGEAAAIPLDPFRAGLNPTDADLQRYYAANRNRYMVPEQRVVRIARIGPDQVAGVTASDQEIASYYNAHKADYAATETRTISQAVVQDQATASAIAGRAKGGATIAAAAAPAGANAAVTTLNDQSRSAYASVAGDAAAAAAFGAPSGGVVGPIKTDFGWAVAKVDSIKTKGGKTLDQAKPEIAAKLNGDKRKGAIEELVDNVQEAVDNGSNFTEAAAKAKLTVTTTPLITGSGTSRIDPNFKLPPELAPALKTGFEIAPNDPPEIVTLPGDSGYAMVSPAQVLPAAPAPFATVRAQVAKDWIDGQATQRARAAAEQIEAKVEKGMPLAQSVKEAGVALPPVQPITARRIQIATAQGQIPPVLKMLFTIGAGKSRMFADPGSHGFVIVKVNKITPANALVQPGVIARMQSELQEGISEEYAAEFQSAVRNEVGARRNDSAINALKSRLLSSGG